MSLVQLFDIVLFEKVRVLKVRYETGLFVKTECIASTYKSGSLMGELPKRTI